MIFSYFFKNLINQFFKNCNKVSLFQAVFAGNLLETIRIRIKLKNKSGSRQAFKIRCTSNDAFRINPPFGIINDKVVEVEFIYRLF